MQVKLDADDLRPLVQQVAAETVLALQADAEAVGGKLAYSEAEAARLLSLEQHQLRDERRRGRIQASVGPGRRILYSRADLLGYLAARRWSADGSG